MPIIRPSWDETCMEMVNIIRKRSTCFKLQVGGLLWNPITKEIVGIAYNGTPHGMPECSESEPLMEGEHHINDLHMEDNLFMLVGRKAEGCTLYCNLSPCRRCVLKCVQARIGEFVYAEGYNLYGDVDYAKEILNSRGINFRQYTPPKP